MILVIGSGVAGLSCAIAAAHAAAGTELEVRLVAPGDLATGDAAVGGSTVLAQGGIAASIGAGDRWQDHLADTLAAGAGIVAADAAELLVREGADAVRRLIAAGLDVDRAPDGAPALGLEAAHGRPRIVHAGGDRTGAVLHAQLLGEAHRLAAAGRLVLASGRRAVELVVEGGAVRGAVLAAAGETGRTVGAEATNGGGHGGSVLSPGAEVVERVRADAVVLATGGYAGLYPRTSNRAGARGEGVVLAARAGALVADLEFVQFHPTVIAGTGSLVSEAVRGAGAVLRDGAGRRFMALQDPRAELAPRDVVSRAIHRVLRERGEDRVWLDATVIERAEGDGTLARRFPAISAAMRSHGLDWAREPVPVVPAAHYAMGGVASDTDGRSTLPGLFVAGETASTGVQGANRLASNSLLEGLVFGARAGRAAAAFASAAPGARRWETRGATLPALAESAVEASRLVEASRARGTDGGVFAARGATAHGAAARGAAAPGTAFAPLTEPANIAPRYAPLDIAPIMDAPMTGALLPGGPIAGASRAAAPTGAAECPVTGRGEAAVAAMLGAELGIERDAAGLERAAAVFRAASGPVADLAEMIRIAALARTESRGAHARADFPERDPAQAHRTAFRFVFPDTPARTAVPDTHVPDARAWSELARAS
ncbi:FAD-binding protein [Leucobacter allii]|uniref:L-aspartate oxidase n=1 Tax=Leucobacter allii TaxID=2932247 RepID=UPI001FD4029D|nr:FAD-binding protein [Leucobacter allii]UOR00646.1 FAD-binding protein [Leucobacter allii]